jgi:GH15 family glucan-1,4-alpha-glucosidase
VSRIEDYALIGDTHSAALVGLDGSIDWLCLPRFDSRSCFAAILDSEHGGRWRIAPEKPSESRRAYRRDSLVLETTFSTEDGEVVLTDCLPFEEGSHPDNPREIHTDDVVLRIVTGASGTVRMKMDYSPRFDYGYVMPWFRVGERAIHAIGGPDALVLRGQVPLQLQGDNVTASFDLGHGDAVAFVAGYHWSYREPRDIGPEDCPRLVQYTDEFWKRWANRCTYQGRWRDEIVRSLLTLKALTYSPTGGIVAAPTTSLPEAIGGPRNWDYRYCWLRDATFTLEVLLEHGYTLEAKEWRDWLQIAVAGDPEDLQIMYGVRGERRLTELELPWMSGYEGSRPVRIGNAAVDQFQLDVHGEVMNSFHSARRANIETSVEAWELEREIVDHVLEHWRDPDEGIWEVRSGPRHFVHSKVMAWVAIDRAIRAVEQYGKTGPIEEWKATRDAISREVFEKGVVDGRFKRAYDDDGPDASLLMLPLVGFVTAADPRMRATVEHIKTELLEDGLVHRYRHDLAADGLPPGEGAFLLCSFWLVDCLILLGRRSEAEKMFERLLELRNDVGLLAEQYDARLERQVGNFPQAFSHVALATAARMLDASDDQPHGLRYA